MAFDKKTWANNQAGGTPLDASGLNDLESRIDDSIDELDVDLASHKAENAIDAHSDMPACSAYKSAQQSIPNNTDTVVTFDLVKFDTDNIKDGNRFVCQTSGVYLISTNLSLFGSSTGHRHFSIRLNGSTILAFSWGSGDIEGSSACLSVLHKLNVGDYVQAVIKQSSGGALSTRVTDVSFSMVKVG